MTYARDPASEALVCDLLMDGAECVNCIAIETQLGRETVRRIIRHLMRDRVVAEYGHICNERGKPVMFYELTRTRKAA